MHIVLWQLKRNSWNLAKILYWLPIKGSKFEWFLIKGTAPPPLQPRPQSRPLCVTIPMVSHEWIKRVKKRKQLLFVHFILNFTCQFVQYFICFVEDSIWLGLTSILASIKWKQIDIIKISNKSELLYFFLTRFNCCAIKTNFIFTSLVSFLSQFSWVLN